MIRIGYATAVIAAAAVAQAQPFSGQCTIADPPGTAEVYDVSDTAAPRRLGTAVGVAAGQHISAKHGSRAALYLRAGGTPSPADVALYLAEDTEILIQRSPSTDRPDDRRWIYVPRGSAVVQYSPRDGKPLAVSTAGAWVRLAQGTLWVHADPPTATLVLVRGRAERFDGALPAGDVGEAAGGRVLEPPAEAPAEPTTLVASLSALRTASIAESWVGAAFVGDIVPTRQAGKETTKAVAERYVASIPITPPQAAAATVTPATGTLVTPQAPAPTAAQALLASGSPATVVVGARLERTRIVGNPGTAGTTGVRFNPEARPPIRLVPRR